MQLLPIVIIVTIYFIIYFTIKTAVREAIVEAHKIIRFNDGQKEKISEDDAVDSISQTTCPNCNAEHDIDYPICPHCGHRYV